MSKWILMPDSFKGTMSSLEICQLMREALLRHVPDAEVVSIPVADGGEGSVEAFLAAMGGHRVEVPCTGPDFRKISGFYGLLADGYTVEYTCGKAGFNNLSHFSRTFKNKVGMSPKQYQQKNIPRDGSE